MHDDAHDKDALAQVRRSLADQDFEQIRNVVGTLVDTQGVNTTVQQIMVVLVRYIEMEEASRGEIARSARSQLAPSAEQAQAILDDIIFSLLGVSGRQRQHIRDRLQEML